MPPSPPDPASRLLTTPFVVVTGAALLYFFALGVVTPVLPVYVEAELGGRGPAVGIVIGSFAVAAAILRPLAGRLGDSRGRRVLVVGGSVAFGLSVLAYGAVASVPWLVGMRLLSGIGEAAVFVGAATSAQDLAPANRRGEAASYFSVAIYGGLGFGPAVGELVQNRLGTGEVWVTAACFAFAAAALGGCMPREAARPDVGNAGGGGRRPFFHRAAVGPGIILFLATSALAAFTAFMPLYALELGLRGSGRVFLLHSVLILAVRILGARLPDRLGAARAASAALVLQAVGFLLMASWAASAGLYASAAVYALGVSLMYPSLMPLVIAAAPDAERGQAVGSFTVFFDLAQGAGALLLGLIVSVGGYRSSFVAAGVLCLTGLAVLRMGPVWKAALAERAAAGEASARRSGLDQVVD